MRFLDDPNIPQDRVCLCAIAAGFPDMKHSLTKLGIEVIEIEPLEALPTPVSAHADMQLHDLGGGRAVAAKGAHKLITALKAHGFEVQEQELGDSYPDDIKLNSFSLNGKLFCNPRGISKLLLNNYQSKGREVIAVKQGYAKCSTCIVNKTSIMTSDPSIAKAANQNGIDVLELSGGGISLTGYDAGFIGGCCGLIAPDKLAFTGSISLHTEYRKIEAFLRTKGVTPIELTEAPLFDSGGILPLAVISLLC